MATENKRMQQLKGDATLWGTNDIAPLEAEIAVELNGVDSRLKVGDGSTLYSVLNYVSRRNTAEFDAEVTAIITAAATDVSAGVADAGKLVLLDAAGLIDSSMLPAVAGASFTILGEADVTGPPPVQTYSAGDVWFNSTAGQANGGWGLGQDVNLNEAGVFVGDMLLYDALLLPAAGWRLIPGQVRTLLLVDRDYADDTAAGVGGVPIGGTYHTSGAVKVRVS